MVGAGLVASLSGNRNHTTMSGSPTYFDAAFLAVALISGLLAMYRGFSREVLSIASWAVAAGAAAWFVFYQKAMAENIAQQMGIPSVQIAQIGVGALIFLVTLIFVHLVTSRISDMILDSRIGMIDRVLGLLFGLGRAFVLVLIPYMGLVAMVEKKADHPAWVNNAWSMQVVQPASESLSVFLKQRIGTINLGKPEKT
jgi:membrane protein required for colicin V production